MKRSIFNYIADIIREYPTSEMYIKKREDELINRFQEFKDENVGGGRAQNKKDEGVECMAITLAEDRRLNNLKRNEEAVRKILESSDPVTRDIIYELYLRENCILTLEGIAQEAHLSGTAVKKRRLKFFEKVAAELGL
ncbi:MAG: transcriptional regulator [Liquorilactobacillus sp.]|uniref:transcriptional regulator n=1 Tax=Liquorilactobacillus nagelii TaxID=82688 RepID=UPI00242EE8F9|nr:transcriptional regulator [Liquorilactobacillus nagelii]MCI1699455.1 transcriptional regulator [Liquorilactobacillus nagelii]